MSKTSNDPLLFAEALSGVGSVLTSVEGIEVFLRQFFFDVVNLKGRDSWEERDAAFRILLEAAADTLLGKDPSAQTIRNWNQPGVIDEFAAKWLGSSETDPQIRMEHCLVKLVGEVGKVVDAADKAGAMLQEWQGATDAIFRRYAFIFAGIDLPTKNAVFYKQGKN
jgi:hypothetical protein